MLASSVLRSAALVVSLTSLLAPTALARSDAPGEGIAEIWTGMLAAAMNETVPYTLPDPDALSAQLQAEFDSIPASLEGIDALWDITFQARFNQIVTSSTDETAPAAEIPGEETAAACDAPQALTVVSPAGQSTEWELCERAIQGTGGPAYYLGAHRLSGIAEDWTSAWIELAIAGDSDEVVAALVPASRRTITLLASAVEPPALTE